MKARDVMVPLGCYLQPEDGLREFVTAMRSVQDQKNMLGVTALPVLDARKQLVGMLSMEDILRAIFPQYLYATDLSMFTWDGMLESLATHAAGKTVGSLMTTTVISIRDDRPLMECVDHMLKHDISTLPVLDRNGAMLGLISQRDIFFAIADALQDYRKARP